MPVYFHTRAVSTNKSGYDDCLLSSKIAVRKILFSVYLRSVLRLRVQAIKFFSLQASGIRLPTTTHEQAHGNESANKRLLVRQQGTKSYVRPVPTGLRYIVLMLAQGQNRWIQIKRDI